MCTDRRTTRQTGPLGRNAPPLNKRTDGNHPNRTARRSRGEMIVKKTTWRNEEKNIEPT